MSVPLIGQIAGPTAASAGSATATTGASGGGFGATLRQAIEHVNQLEQDAGAEIRSLLTGETEDWHRALLAVQKAEMAFQMFTGVRNKVVEAYQEIMRIQV
jgi:flagellar hook-basal body complex protein FliE